MPQAKRTPDYERIAALSSDGYFRASPDTRIQDANDGFLALIGSVGGAEAPLPSLADLIHSDSMKDLQALLERLTSGDHASESAVLRLVRGDGTMVWVELFAVADCDDQGRLLAFDGVARDVSEHLQIADLLSRTSLEQRALLEAQRELLTTLNFEETLRSIVERAQELLNARLAVVFLLEDENLLAPTAVASELQNAASINPCRVGEGVIGRAVQDGEPRYVPEVSGPGNTSPLSDIFAGRGSMLIAPLQPSAATAGVLAIVGEVGQYDEGDLDFLVALSQIASLALVNSEAHRAVERLAMIDPLTGAFNRRFLDKNLRAELARAEKIGYPLGVLMFDVDDLKGVNDRFGHPAGDEVLRHVVDVCRTQLRETDWIVRYGGDEFFAVLPGCGLDSLHRVAEKLWHGLAERPVELEGSGPRGVNISMGGAVKGEGWVEPELLVAAADRAERAAKKSTSNQLYVEALPESTEAAPESIAQEVDDN